VREVGGGIKSGSELVPEPPKRVAGSEQYSFDLNGEESYPLVDLFSFFFFFFVIMRYLFLGTKSLMER